MLVALVEIWSVSGFVCSIGEDAATRMERRGWGVRMEEGGIYGLGVRDIELVESCRGSQEPGNAGQIQETQHTSDLREKQTHTHTRTFT